jgi:3-dehydroquinate dehydratase-2
MNSAAHVSAASAGRAIESSVATGRAPIAATSLKFTARDLRPNSRGEVAVRRKWTPSVSRSAVKTSDSPPPTDNTEQSSPMPSNPLSGSGAKRVFMLSMNPNSVMEELCYGAKLPIFSVNLIIFVRESPAWGVRLMNETMKILILNGPNLNLQGRRDTGVYGSQTFESYFEALKANYPSVEFGYFQSNIEGELIDAVQQADGVYDGVVLNAGGYTHTSVALRDAVSAVSVPVVEVHISSILAREEFRHTSLLAPVAAGSIMGFGLNSYRLGVYALLTGAEK